MVQRRRPTQSSGILLLALLISLGSLGCAGARRDLLTPPEAPAPPRARSVALDSAMVGSAVQIVREMMNAEDPIRRAHAVEAIQHLPPEQALPLLEEGIADADPRVRFAATMAAGRMRLAQLKPQFEAMAAGDSPNGQVAGVFALHRIGDTSQSHRFTEFSQSGNSLVRANTAVALGLLGEVTAVRLLRPMQEDPDANVRLNVAEALWRLRDEDGFEALLAASISGYSDDRVLGTLALAGPYDARAKPALHGKLTDEYVEVQLAAARGLGALGSDRGYAVAASRLDDRDARRRAMAALALGEIGRLDAQPLIEPLLSDSSPDVRLAAATATLMLAESAGEQPGLASEQRN